MGQHGTPVEFWPTRRVLAAIGLSKSEMYRRIDEGSFPRPRKYQGTNINFWPSPEVIAWQRAELGDNEFEALLAL